LSVIITIGLVSTVRLLLYYVGRVTSVISSLIRDKLRLEDDEMLESSFISTIDEDEPADYSTMMK
jgi:hypothetical protein